MTEPVNMSVLNRVVHTLYNELSVFYCILYCYTVFSASHDQASCLWNALRLLYVSTKQCCNLSAITKEV